MTDHGDPANAEPDGDGAAAEGPRRRDRRVIGPFTLGQIAALAATLGAVAVILVGLTAPIRAPGPSELPRPGNDFFRLRDAADTLEVGDRAPELEGLVDDQLVTLTDLDGRPLRMADLRGRPVWLNFWASWCPPCQQETPVLRELYDAYDDEGLALVAVSVQETTVDDVRRYAQTYALRYTIGFDATSAVFDSYAVFGLPTHFFIDREGVIREIIYGPLTHARAEEILEPLLRG